MNDKVNFTFKRKLQLWFFEPPLPCTVYKGTGYGVYKLPRREMVPFTAPQYQLLCVLLLLDRGVKTRRSNENSLKEL